MSGYSTTWGQALCQRLGVPASLQNDLLFRAWAQSEGGNAAYNPFNTTQKMPGSKDYNATGVQNYISPAQGFEATAQTLTNGKYTNILASLYAGTSARTTAYALQHSPWGTGALVTEVLVTGSTKPVTMGAYPYVAVGSTASPVHLSRVQPGKLSIDVFTVQRALHLANGLDYSKEPSYFGSATDASYAKWQYSLGYRGVQADGSPGIKSLTSLGAKYGFSVLS